MEQQKVDMFMMVNNKYFPESQILFIRERLLAADESKEGLLHALQFKDPTIALILSVLTGNLGIDRFEGTRYEKYDTLLTAGLQQLGLSGDHRLLCIKADTVYQHATEGYVPSKWARQFVYDWTDYGRYELTIEPRLLSAFKRIRKNSRNGLGIVYVQRDACGKKEQVCAGECAVSAQKDHQQTEYVNAEQNQARDAHFRRRQPAQHNRCKTEQNLEGAGGHRIIEDARTFRIALDCGERTGKECRAENHGAEDDAAP